MCLHRSIKRGVMICALAVLCAGGTRASLYAMEPVIIDEALTVTVIGRSIEYFEDTDRSFSFNDIMLDRTAGRLAWQRSRKEKPGFGFREAVYWVRFALKNPTGRDIAFYLHQEYPHIDRLALYVPDKTGAYSVIQTGAAYPFSQRPYKYKNFIFPLTIGAGVTETLYLRLDSHGSINIHLSVASPETFERIKNNDAIFYWLFYGIFFVMFIFNLFIFFSTRDRSYIYYTLYIASFGLFTMTLDGMAFQYLWPGNAAIGKLPIAITMVIIIFSIIQFAVDFTNMREQMKISYVIFKAIAILSVILLVIMLVNRNYWFAITSANALAGIAASLAIVSITYQMIARKSRQALFFICSYVLFLLGVITVVLFHRGIVPPTFLTMKGIYIGAVFQVMTLSIGLVDKINIMKNELGLLHRDLELKVEERTGELNAIHEEVLVINRNLMDVKNALWAEIQLAKKIQTVLLPETPAIPGYNLSTYMRPAEDTGGDYYDIINTGGMDWIVIGDVSGHGVPAGLIMMMAQTAINTVIRDRPDLTPSEVLIKVNRTLYRNIRKLGGEKFMTLSAFAAHREGKFVFSGLHQDIMIYRKNRAEVELIETNGMWLGMVDELSDTLADSAFEIGIGDIMLLYTDGVINAREKDTVKEKSKHESPIFGEGRLKNIFTAAGSAPISEIKTRILEELERYVCNDDITIVIIQRVS